MPLPIPAITRRNAVKAVASAPFVLSAAALARGTRANAGIGVGVIGTGKRAFELLGNFLPSADVHIVAVCDVDTTRRNHAKKVVDERYKPSDAASGCATFTDHRELLAHKGVDAVIIATPDHWHVNQVVDAANAKKDIYCEKPLTLRLDESRMMIDACRRHNIVFQTGSQQRTEYDHKFVTACEYVRSGRIGDLITVHVGVPTSSKPCDLPEEPIEPGLDWDRWLGPAPTRPYNSVLAPRGVHTHYPAWRNYSEYSGGGMTDFGAHNFDIAQWGMDMDASGPVAIVPPQNPKAMHGAKLIYANGVEVVHAGSMGITFTGTKGMIHVFRDYLLSIPDGILKEPLKDSDVRLPRHAAHHVNWIECIRSRQRPLCDVEVGVRSIACAHLCNLAYWHRRALRWDPKAWEFPGDAEANGWCTYQRRAPYTVAPIA